MYARLEPLSDSRHSDSLFDALQEDSEGRVWRYLADEPFESAQEFSTWVKSVEAWPDCIYFAVQDLDTGRWGGYLCYLRIKPNAGSIEIGGIAYAPCLQRRRSGSEAIILLARHAFALGYRRLEWKCNALNAASRRAAQRYGFSYEGTFRQATVVKGRNRDTAWFSIIDREFPLLNEAYTTWLDPSNFDAERQQITRLSELTAPLLVAVDPEIS